MSTSATNIRSRRGQQTLAEAVNLRRIREPILGVHKRFELFDDEAEQQLRGDTRHSHVVLNFSEVEEVIERDGSLDEVLEEWHIPIVVATQDDAILDTRSFQDVLNVLFVLPPAIFVPDIVYNYDTMQPNDQVKAIKAYVFHVRELERAIAEHNIPVRLLPTNKGWTVPHFELYRELYEECGYTEMALYGVQYSGGPAGNATRQLRRHATFAIQTLNLENVFVIGRLALDELLRFDPRVNGACGLRQLQTEERFADVQRRLQRALFANSDHTQSNLTTFQ